MMNPAVRARRTRILHGARIRRRGWTAATLVTAAAVGYSYARPVTNAALIAVLVICAFAAGVAWAEPIIYRAGWSDGIESEHYFDDASVLNPATGKPYGPGPLWAGTEPMDYPDPRCVCGALWLEDACGRHLLPPPPVILPGPNPALCSYPSPELIPDRAGRVFYCSRPAGHEFLSQPDALNHSHPEIDMVWRSRKERSL
jgi:hypothetical protein